MPASAFSAYGAGTNGNPYRIATCAQLSEIDNNLSASYVLVRDIDCNSIAFDHLAHTSPFSGTLDGRNHTIYNIDIDAYGLFYETSGATIKNLQLKDGSISDASAYAGSFVAFAENNTTLQNLHSNVTIDGTTQSSGGVYVGGLVAQLKDGSTLSKSSYSGNLTANTYAGGLVGITYGSSPVSISDSFSSGTFNLTTVTSAGMPVDPAYNGGIIGTDTVSTQLDRVYSSMTINVDNQSVYTGGIVGATSTMAIANSFSAATINDAGGIYTGSITGTGGNLSGVYFDQHLAGGSDCSGTNAVSCSAVNNGNSNPNYFRNNSTSAPFTSWDFDSVWKTTSGYPTLRNLDAFTVGGIPNNGDANGDSINDMYQQNVISAVNSNNVWSTVEIPDTAGCSLDDASAYDPTTTKFDTGYTATLQTMTGFSVYCSASGVTVPVTIIYDKLYETSNAVLRQYNPTTNTYVTVAGATFGTRVVGGTPKTIVTYSITDGGPYDTDGIADGRIVDPVGLAVADPAVGTVSSVRAPNTGLPTESGLTTALLLISAGGLMVASNFVRHRCASQ
jgi:M26 IgA1-specific Metallo-endopeptidase N-terminal region